MRFVLDENMPPSVAKALKCVDKPVDHMRERVPRGTADVEWIALMGPDDIVVTCDANILCRPSEAAAVRLHGLRLVLWPDGLSLWEHFALFVKVLPDLERLTANPKKRHHRVHKRGHVVAA